MMTLEELGERADRVLAQRYASPLIVEDADRDEFAVALVLQGYSNPTAHRMAFFEIEDNDGALQMLARHRIASAKGGAV